MGIKNLFFACVSACRTLYYSILYILQTWNIKSIQYYPNRQIEHTEKEIQYSMNLIKVEKVVKGKGNCTYLYKYNNCSEDYAEVHKTERKDARKKKNS